MRFCWIVVALVLGVVGRANAQTGNSTAPLEQALQELKEHLGFDEAGYRWNQRLKTEDLLDLVIQRASADVAELEKIHTIFAGKDKELEAKPIAKVRRLLKQHIAAVRHIQKRQQQITGALPDYKPLEDRKALYAATQARLDTARTALENYLNNSGSENAKAWRKHFEWDTVTSLLDEERRSERPSQRRYNGLLTLRNNFYGRHPGLGERPVIEFRNALDDYARHAVLAKVPENTVKSTVENWLSELEADIANYEWDEAPTDRAAIGENLMLLEKWQQTPQFVRRLRGHYWQPNVDVRVAEALAGAGVNDIITDTSPVSEHLMGTDIRGTAHTNGQFYLGLAPSDKGVSLAVCVDAKATAFTTGYRRKVRVHSTGNTKITASKAMFFTEDGTLSADPAFARCDTQSTITGVEHKLRLVRRIAYNKAQEFKPMGEQYASDKGEREAAKQLDDRVTPLVSQANEAYASKIQKPLYRFELYPRWLNLSSNFNSLGGRFLVASRNQLGASTLPPPLPMSPLAAGWIRIHESALSNVADNLLRSFTLDNKNAVQILTDLKREIPDELKRDEEWSMRFSRENSVVVRFRDNRIHLGFRGDQFGQGDKRPKVNHEIEFSAVYEVELRPRSVVLRRVGDVQSEVIIDDPDEFVPPDAITVQQVIVRKFDSVFKQELVIESQKLPKPYDKAGDILPAFFTAGYGWATVGINAGNINGR